MDTTERDRYIIQLIMALMYASIGAVAASCLYRLMQKEGRARRKLFHSTILLNCAGRVAFLCVPPHYNMEEKFWVLVLESISGDFFFTTWSLLIDFWADVYRRAHAVNGSGSASSPRQHLLQSPADHTQRGGLCFPKVPGVCCGALKGTRRSTLLVANILLYTCQAVIFCLPLTSLPMKTIFAVDGMFFGVLSLFSAIGFMLYGYRLLHALRSVPVHSSEKQSKMRLVGWVTVVSTVCFTIRAFYVSWQNYPSVFDKYENSWYDFMIMVSYYCIVELVPLTLVLYMLQRSGLGTGSTGVPSGLPADEGKASPPLG